MRFELNAEQLAATGKQYLTAGDLLGESLHTGLDALASDVGVQARELVAAATPRGETGRLGASTIDDTVMTETGFTTSILQPAESEKNWDGSGGGFPYVLAVVGGRRAISAPSTGPFSTGKMALRTPWGPRTSVGPSAPNPYPDLVGPQIARATELLAEHWSTAISERVSRTL